MKHMLFVVALLVVSIAVNPAWAAEDKVADVTDMKVLRDAVRSDKKAFVASHLDLKPAEEKRFWPIYDTYQRIVDGSNRRRVIAVEGALFRDKPMDNLAAKNLATELLASDEAEIKARRTLQNRVMRALPPIKAARYLQLEDKIRAAQIYDIASTVPLLR